ncbi:MAG: hypothetical protein ACYCTI_00190 [Acidimicrobiales bacterium]
MSRFIGDERDFRRPGQARVLVLTEDLLEELHVTDRPRVDQERAVRDWLGDHEPGQVLALSLQQDGFVPENLSNKLSNEPRRMGEDEAGRNNGETRSDLHEHGYTGTTPDRPGQQTRGS